jgi:hypothetical protein
MALTTAGGYSRGKTQENFVNEVNRQNRQAYDVSQQAREAERERQQGFETQANNTFASTLSGMGRENFDAAQETAAQDFVATTDALPDALNANTRLPGQDLSSSVVSERMAASAGRQAADSRARLQALAKVVGTGGATQGRATAIGGAGDTLSTLGGLRRGSLAVGQQEQTVTPANVTPGSTTFADLLSGAGMIMGLGGPGLFSGAGGQVGSFMQDPAMFQGLLPAGRIRPIARPF